MQTRDRISYSPALQRDMHMRIIGHAGKPCLVFPSQNGRCGDFEAFGMHESCQPWIDQGKLKLYCVDSVDKDSWYARWKSPEDRAHHQTAYENYLTREVLPLSRQKNNNLYLIAVGASFGAYHAVNFALRHPHLVNRTIGLSGFYDISRWAEGRTDRAVYFHNPCAYIPNEHDERRLAELRRLEIILAVGRHDSLVGNNEHFSHLLWEKGIWHALRVWDGWCHDWPYWKDMLHTYIGGAK